MTRHREPAPQPDAALDAYRGVAARVFDNDRLVGHLVTRVVTVWTLEGPFWHRRLVRPTECIEWFLEYQREEPLAHADGWDDGIAHGTTDLDRNEFELQGRTLRLQWLGGEEVQRRLEALDWESR